VLNVAQQTFPHDSKQRSKFMQLMQQELQLSDILELDSEPEPEPKVDLSPPKLRRERYVTIVEPKPTKRVGDPEPEPFKVKVISSD